MASEICQRLRSHPAQCSTPIIFISARLAEGDCIRGLELGANDYIIKPFFPREVIARIKVQLRRPVVERTSLLRVGELELDRMRRRVWRSRKELSLTANEFRLLEYLMDRAGMVFSRQLVDAVWSNHHEVSDRSVDVYVFRLRRKLGRDPGNPPVIRCLRGLGYAFDG
jgi:DNA-binding response OmpR family regulator